MAHHAVVCKQCDKVVGASSWSNFWAKQRQHLNEEHPNTVLVQNNLKLIVRKAEAELSQFNKTLWGK